MSKARRRIVGLWIFILLGLFLWKPGIGFADTSPYERSEKMIKEQLLIIEKELARNYTCEKAPNIIKFREAESSLFTELHFLKLNEKRHFVSHPDFSGILSYCDLISECKCKVAKLGKFNKLIEEKIKEREIAKKAQQKMAETMNRDFRDRVMKGAIKLLEQLNPATSMWGFVRKIAVMSVKATGHQETPYVLKGEFAQKNSDQITRNVNNFIKKELRPEYKKNYPDSIGARIERKLKNGEPLNYNENSFLRLVAKRTQQEIAKLAKNKYEGLKTEIAKLEKERDSLQQHILNQKKWCKPYKSFCNRIKNFQLWPTRSPVPQIVVRLTTSTVQVQKGDSVIFTYSVKNFGNVALSGVRMTDDILSQIQLTDKNQDTDNLLDPGETWTYQSRVNIQRSTVNCAQASGKDVVNRQPVDAKSATVNVTVLSPATPMVTVPDLIGSTRDSAEEDLRQANLTLSRPVQIEESTQHEGLICRQDPVSRKLVPRGSPVRIWISQERKPDVRRLFIDPPTRTIRAKNTVQLRAFIWYEDGSEEEVTERASWKGAPGGVFTNDKPGTYIIAASHESYTGSATIIVQEAPWTVYDGKPPISDADDVNANVPKPGPGDYKWYVLCNKKSGDVVYGKYPDPIWHHTMAGPFPGPRTAEKWIMDNCPRARCTTGGECAKGPAKGGKWHVVCNKKTGAITFTKHRPGSLNLRVMAGGFRGEPEARLWQEQNCPMGRCDSSGRCARSPVAVRPSQGGWYVTCYLPTGNIEIGKKTISYSSNKVLAGPYLGEPDARLWVDQNCPSWRCDSHGRCLSGGFREIGQDDGRSRDVSSGGGFGMLGHEDGEQNSGGSGGFEMLGQTAGVGTPIKREPGSGSDEFAAPDSSEAHKAIEETEKARPEGKRFAAEWNNMRNDLDRTLARQRVEANQFLIEGLTATAKIAGDIAASNIKRKSDQTPQKPQFPYDLSRPPGPTWTPDAGWGGKGDKLKRCRDNYAALQAAKNDTDRFRSLLGGAKGCDHYKKAQWHLAKLERRDRCSALRAKLQAAAQANDVITYRDLVNKAQIYDCKEVYQWARAQQRSVEQKAREQKERERIARIKPPSNIGPGGGTIGGGAGGGTSGTGGSTMSYDDCLKKHCPECSQELGLMHVGVTYRCEGCKRRKQKILSQCSGLRYDPGCYKTEWYVIEHLRYNEEKHRWEPTGNYSVENRKEKSKIEGKQDCKVIYGPAYWDQCDKKREDLQR